MFRGQSQLGTCVGGSRGLSSYKTSCCFGGMEISFFFFFLDNKKAEQDEVEQKKN